MAKYFVIFILILKKRNEIANFKSSDLKGKEIILLIDDFKEIEAESKTC